MKKRKAKEYWKVPKRKTVIRLLCLLFISINLFGCKKEEKEAPVELTIVSGWGGNFQSHEVMRGIYEDFDRQNEDIELKYISYSDNAIAVEKAIDMLAIGNEADIVSTNGASAYVEYAVMHGKAMNLAPYIMEDKEWFSQIHPAVFETWQNENGELYTLPDALEVIGYWYNESYLRQAGIVDENGEVCIPGTWPEFMEMVRKLHSWIEENRLDISVAALEDDQTIGALFLARLTGEGEDGVRAAISEYPDLTEDTITNVTDTIHEIQQHSESVSNIEDARQKFSDGKTILYFGGVWEAHEFEKSEYQHDMGYANYPSYQGKSLSYVSASSGYVVAKQESERKSEACIRFLKYMFSESVQEHMALMTSQAPSNITIPMEPIKEKKPLLGEALEVAYSADIQIPTIYSTWKESKMKQIEERIGNR